MKHIILSLTILSLSIFAALAQQDILKFKNYNYPRIVTKSKDFKMKVNGTDILVYHTSAAPFAAFTCEGEVNIEIEIPSTNKIVSISPKRLGIVPTIEGNKVSFKIPNAMNMALEFEGMPQLFIYANSYAKNIPNESDPKVRFFKGGQVYEVGMIEMHDNETIYIEEGAVVRGCVRATSAKNIRICGNGVLDASYFTRGVDDHRSIVFENCQNAIIEDIIMIEPQSWMIMLGACENILVKNVKELGLYSGTDGVDIVGCKKVKVENCIFRNGDDCIAIKSLKMKREATIDYSKDVEDIEITNSTFVAYEGGTAMEIGHELRTNSIKNIRFTNCDILGVHGFGGVFGIHNADRAVISDVLYENIRVEHHYNKLIDLKVIKSMWGRDEERGQIKNILFKNIDVDLTIYNSGYSMSILGGYDEKHKVENVVFDNFRVQSVKITNGDELSLFTKQTKGIVFK